MNKKAVIIGGGIIGLSCAYYLRRNGLEVTILEKNEFGKGSSWGNQGWVSPALHEPVPAPGLIGDSIKWLMKEDSPLYINPSAFPKLIGWLTQFMKHCNERDFEIGENALLGFSRSTLEFYDSLESDGLNFEMYRKGMLFVFLKEEELNLRLEKLQRGAEKHGHEMPEVLTGEEVRELEPNISNKVVGGLLLKNQRHVKPDTLTTELVKWLRSSGVDLSSKNEVIDIKHEGDQVITVNSQGEHFTGDILLLATGANSSELAKKLGFLLPVQAGKGYSITISNPNLKFKQPVYLGDSKAGISPFNDTVRVGGTMELSGINTRIDERRVKSLRESISKYTVEELKGDSEIEWAGMRPMTPDSLPVIGRVPDYENIFVATGHGMVGLSMAPATGKAISDLICFGSTELDITSFDPQRFL